MGYLQHARRHLEGGTDPFTGRSGAWANWRFEAIIEPTTARYLLLTDLDMTLQTTSDLYGNLDTRTDDLLLLDYAALLPLTSKSRSQLLKLEAYAYASEGEGSDVFASWVTSGVSADLGVNAQFLLGAPAMHLSGPPGGMWPPYLVFNPYVQWSWVALKLGAEEFTIGIFIDNTTADYVVVAGDLFALKLDPPMLGD